MKIKEIPREKLIIRPSMPMFFGGGEIWFEQLDALSVYTDIVTEKFLVDMKDIVRPSTPSRIAVNLNETLDDENVAEVICGGLSSAGKNVQRVVFVGLDRNGKKLVERFLPETQFIYAFIDDYEKAKEWLVG